MEHFCLFLNMVVFLFFIFEGKSGFVHTLVMLVVLLLLYALVFLLVQIDFILYRFHIVCDVALFLYDHPLLLP